MKPYLTIIHKQNPSENFSFGNICWNVEIKSCAPSDHGILTMTEFVGTFFSDKLLAEFKGRISEISEFHDV